MTSVMAVSNTILSMSFQESIPVTPLKLHWLLYLLYREYLQKYDKPLFSERFLLLRHGPVLRSAQEKFDSFAEKAISRFAKDALDNVFVVDEWKGADIVDAIQSVWAKYKAYDGISLSRLLCSPGTAWSKADEQGLAYLRDEDIKAEIGF